jgi:hypothetical protein
VWIKKYSWAVPAHTFLNFFEKIVARRLNESIHEKRPCIIIIDRKAFNSFNAVR